MRDACEEIERNTGDEQSGFEVLSLPPDVRLTYESVLDLYEKGCSDRPRANILFRNITGD